MKREGATRRECELAIIGRTMRRGEECSSTRYGWQDYQEANDTTFIASMAQHLTKIVWEELFAQDMRLKHWKRMSQPTWKGRMGKKYRQKLKDKSTLGRQSKRPPGGCMMREKKGTTIEGLLPCVVVPFWVPNWLVWTRYDEV